MISRVSSIADLIFRKKIGISISVFVGFALILPNFSNAQLKLQKPPADFAITDLVPLDEAREIAEIKAQEIAGEDITLGEVIFCSNRLGKLGTYMFVFRMRGFPFPPEEEILSKIKKGKEHEREILAYRVPEELKSQLDPDEIMEKAAQMGIPITRPDGTMSGLYGKIEREALLKKARKMKYGIDDYLTIYVSASYQSIPVPLYRKCLPPFYHSYESGIREAREVLGLSDVLLSKYYFLGVWGEFFEFTDMKNRVLINALSNERIRDDNRILNFQNALESLENTDPRIRDTVREEWIKWSRRVEEGRFKKENGE
jgi:hypothetical protein